MSGAFSLPPRPPLLDPATRSTTAYRVWAIIAGPLNAVLVGVFLSASAQGLYYSFGSMAQLVIYLELGLGFALQQLVSHEFAHLKHGSEGAPEGDPQALDRLRGLMRWALRWYAGIAVITLILLPVGGYLFLSNIDGIENLQWKWPWLMLSIWVGFSVLWVPCWPLLEGSDLVAPLYRFRLRQGIISRLGSWAALGTGNGLLAPFIERFTLGVQALIWLPRAHGAMLRSAFRAPQKHLTRWSSQIWPLQWRLALSTAGGFTAFALLVPALLWAEGPVAAGRLGMSFALVNAVYTVCHGLVQARQPVLAMTTAAGKYREMEVLFSSRFRWAIALYTFGCLGLLGTVAWSWTHFPVLHTRILEWETMALLAGAMGIRLARDLLNLYGRSFKKEPFFVLELTQGVLAAALLPWAAIQGGASGMLWAWLGINLALAGPNWRAFIHFRRIHTQ